ncbi:hypothetical protein H6F78_18230 [Coleofasciculus sp. FACHB-64]|uniref:Ycf66 family protein n=1 Tax=Cyanophyceae TaxID=3028117 RepID=UPI0016898D5D|nr:MULTISPECIES: Ycf66 family protein [unclassified Coleofasciculus]MBD1839071.1 hypothetical protein [Coleofasciculus sp. FACHB-501]MBD1902491.1 hypothetical protein [Coleofasciculus sp. FACHB-125]MBD2047509.1 hypothetical protein [Coleofasciculus sp. FACHB-64]
MINFGLNSASILGLLYIILAITYLSLIRSAASRRTNNLSDSVLKLDKFVSVIIRSLLLISGIILFLQGWRLDPVLQFGQFLLFSLILYMIGKDIVIERLERHR